MIDPCGVIPIESLSNCSTLRKFPGELALGDLQVIQSKH